MLAERGYVYCDGHAKQIKQCRIDRAEFEDQVKKREESMSVS
jgi:hypothetical protein